MGKKFDSFLFYGGSASLKSPVRGGLRPQALGQKVSIRSILEPKISIRSILEAKISIRSILEAKISIRSRCSHPGFVSAIARCPHT